MDFIDSAAKKVSNTFKTMMERYDFSFSFIADPVFQRWSIALSLCLLLAIILAPELHFSSPKYILGSIASENIKADRDLLVEDQESTKQKKFDAGENVKSIYDYDSNVAGNIKNKLARAFNAVEEFRQSLPKEKPSEYSAINIHEAQKIKKILEKNLGISLNSEEIYALQEQKYSSKLQYNISRLIVSLYENKFITNANLSKADMEKGITIRNVKTQTEEAAKDLKNILNMKELDDALAKRVKIIFSQDDQDVRRMAFSIAKKLFEPNLTFNKDATEKNKLVAIDNVKPVFFQVQKNEMIIREGEKINPSALSKLNALFKMSGDSKFSSISVLLGIFFTALFLAVVMYFWRTRNWLKTPNRSNLDLFVFGIIAVLQILCVKIGIFIVNAVTRAFPFLSADTCYLAIPFALGAMIISVLVNRNVALIMSVLTSFMIGFIFDDKIIIPLFSFLGSVAASYQIVNSRHRSAFLKVGIFLGVMNMATVVCLNLLGGNLFNDLLWRLFMGFLGGILTGILVAGLTPVFESVFGFMTDIKLLELANLNQPLFQKMIIEAPGTYHHSIIVASLVEAASEAIGANSLLAKVSAYYHDIGKLKKPQYFIENQPGNENKHDKLSPKMSSLIIISHVKDGCELAGEVRIGKPIIDIIREHHGTSIVSYFYDKAKKDKDESIRALSESDFRYPGPKPQTKEAGLVMLGDVVEASSRTLSNPTPARIRSLVRERIERIYTDGQLDECELTLKNLNTIAETFTRILTGIFHHRVYYPENSNSLYNGKSVNENTNRKQTETT
jgi:hypothetical protein